MIRCVRLWTGDDGNSHFEEGSIDLEPGALSTSDVEDIVIGTKVRLAAESESRPAVTNPGDPSPAR